MNCECVPAGAHKAIFQGITEGETEFGDKLYVDFTLEGKDTKIRGFLDADQTPRPTNKFGRWIAAFGNKLLEEGTTINWREYVGRKYLLVVVPAKDTSKTRLETFSLIEEEQPKAEEVVAPKLDDLSIEQIQAMLKRKQEQ